MDIIEINTEKALLIESVKTVVLSTLDEYNYPYVSYAPFIEHEGKFYVMVSNGARHTQYLRTNPNAGLLFIEDESKAKNIFFRKRLSLQVKATLDTLSKDILEAMKARFGEVVTTFLTMDFTIVEFEAKEGQLILGPGQAFKIEGDTVSHIKGVSHQSK
ncbi:pyridoxamine 5'-phosphate oxidase family protein [Acholeplasma vituli]|uniref:Pyridoxamine 5'-phosphate oxidase family protein n=1 Tax=Paracholeplasma vituli TaxID=69473 RepID=A0ABT2PUJ9_9MOLU|nr:pyridoxamine 5'-phosphate oxidase family protein [Paracholeplasma vituli]MCU0104607.1 pyridoxamine 5'-phosphate oxidase family protein [Paracholeplasma vituli]